MSFAPSPSPKPPKQPTCPISKTIVDRYNKKLVCLKGQMYSPDIWITPDPKCPRIMSYRCSKCSCGPSVVCSSPPNGPRYVQNIESWSVQGSCCIPKIRCIPGDRAHAAKPPMCDKCACPYGGNPDNPNIFSTWERVGPIPNPPNPGPVPPSNCIRVSCGYVSGEMRNGELIPYGFFVYSDSNCRGTIIALWINNACVPWVIAHPG